MEYMVSYHGKIHQYHITILVCFLDVVASKSSMRSAMICWVGCVALGGAVPIEDNASKYPCEAVTHFFALTQGFSM